MLPTFKQSNLNKSTIKVVFLKNIYCLGLVLPDVLRSSRREWNKKHFLQLKKSYNKTAHIVHLHAIRNLVNISWRWIHRSLKPTMES